MTCARNQADLTIVGLGPGPADSRTLAVQRELDAANHIFVRGHEGMEISDLLARQNVTDLAPLHQPDAAPGGRWQVASQAVCQAAANGPVVMAISGHPRFGEGIVISTLLEADQRGLTTNVLDGVSVVDLVATALGCDPIAECAQLFTGRHLAAVVAQVPHEGGISTVSPRRPVLLTHAYDSTICTAIHQVLARFYPPDHRFLRIEAAGMPHERISEHAMSELAAMDGGPLVALWIPALDTLEAGADPGSMQQIVARLRRPDGCPWDRKQTYASLSKNLVDEVYEAVDAIKQGDVVNLAEELGDLYLLILMLAQIAHEAGDFSIEDVYAGITWKIVGRHPHVFGDAVVESEADLKGVWAAAKAKEVSESGKRGGKDLDGEPFSMPALTRATRVLKKHPVTDGDGSPEFLRLVAGIVASGNDPDDVLREQLRQHVASAPTDNT